MYKDEAVIVATKHQKEEVIRPVFEESLGCYIHVPTQYDTDQFGTFTGEISRKLLPYETLIQKASKAAHQFGYRYAISSEGSFGPHPSLYFAPGDIEMMAFIDVDSDLIVAEIEVSSNTNYGHFDITPEDDYKSFLEKSKFPSHGLIVRALDDKDAHTEKGIRDLRQLEMAINKAFQCCSIVRIETDMRAMMNPLRMQVIKTLAIKLAKRIQQHCPQCHTPGFGKVSAKGTLACSACSTQTELYQQKMLSCVKCEYKIYKQRDDGLKFADPAYCPSCNP